MLRGALILPVGPILIVCGNSKNDDSLDGVSRGGKEDHGEQKKKKGCRMTRGAERQREVQPEVMGWGWEAQIEWPP